MSRSAESRSAESRPRRTAAALGGLGAVLLAMLPASAARAETPTPAPTLVDAPFDRPRDSTDATGLNLRVLDLVLPEPLDLVFTVRSQDNSINTTDRGPATELALSTDVLFAFGESTLTPKADALIRKVAADVNADAVGRVTITGHADSRGTDAVNVPLSKARAKAVHDALAPLVTTAGITYTVDGRGSSQPVAPNEIDGKDNPAGRALNRRVTIAYTRAGSSPPSTPSTPSTRGLSQSG